MYLNLCIKLQVISDVYANIHVHVHQRSVLVTRNTYLITLNIIPINFVHTILHQILSISHLAIGYLLLLLFPFFFYDANLSIHGFSMR